MRWASLALGALLSVSAVAETPPAPSRRQFEIGTYEGVPWPIVPAPVDGPLPAPLRWTEAAPAAATKAAARVVGLLGDVERSMTASRYQARTEVDVRAGTYHWDCSGMASWIVKRAAPTAWKSLQSARPVARTFAKAIAASPTAKPRRGWQRIDHIADVLPGDLFAWQRPRGMPSKNTGHVGFVVDRPLPVPGLPGAWAVRIADSTSFGHQADSRDTDTDGGYGTGVLTFLTDAAGRATHYGWFGTWTDWYVVTPVVFGRVSK